MGLAHARPIMASVDMMPAIVTQLQLLEATGQSLQHEDLLWEFFEQQVVPAIQMYQMQSAPNCCPDEPTLSTDLFEEMLISSVQHQPIHKVGQYIGYTNQISILILCRC